MTIYLRLLAVFGAAGILFVVLAAPLLRVPHEVTGTPPVHPFEVIPLPRPRPPGAPGAPPMPPPPKSLPQDPRTDRVPLLLVEDALIANALDDAVVTTITRGPRARRASVVEARRRARAERREARRARRSAR